MDASSVSEAPVVSAGNLGLDIALGVGGYPAEESSRSMVLKHQANHHGSLCHRRGAKSWRYCGLY